MAINTKKVFARRPLRYDSYQDLVNDAERLAACDVRSLGNWSLGQTLGHLARAMEMSIDGADFKASWLVRIVAHLLSPTLHQRPDDARHSPVARGPGAARP